MGSNSAIFFSLLNFFTLTLLHSEWPKLHRVLAALSAIGLRVDLLFERLCLQRSKQDVTEVFPLCKNGGKTTRCTHSLKRETLTEIQVGLKWKIAIKHRVCQNFMKIGLELKNIKVYTCMQY